MRLKTNRESFSTDLFLHENKKLKTSYNNNLKETSKKPDMLPLEYINPEAEFENMLDDAMSRIENLFIDKSTKPNKEAARSRDLKKKALDIRSLHDDIFSFDEFLNITKPKPKKVEIPPLTPEEDALVTRTLAKGQHGVIAQYKTATVEYKDIYKLYPETWLNDEIINFYMALLSDRSERDTQLPKIHCFNTFFCSTLREQGYNKVRRWTKKVDIFSKDILLIPINRSFHWVLGAVDMNAKCIRVYDSLGGPHESNLQLILDYLEQEHQDKKKQPIDLSDWTTEAPKGIPQQENMSDCGVFTCTFAERLARKCVFDFSQQDMVLLRRRMVLNILKKQL